MNNEHLCDHTLFMRSILVFFFGKLLYEDCARDFPEYEDYVTGSVPKAGTKQANDKRDSQQTVVCSSQRSRNR